MSKTTATRFGLPNRRKSTAVSPRSRSHPASQSTVNAIVRMRGLAAAMSNRWPWLAASYECPALHWSRFFTSRRPRESS